MYVLNETFVLSITSQTEVLSTPESLKSDFQIHNVIFMPFRSNFNDSAIIVLKYDII